LFAFSLAWGFIAELFITLKVLSKDNLGKEGSDSMLLTLGCERRQVGGKSGCEDTTHTTTRNMDMNMNRNVDTDVEKWK
jgi:hypothetical protein